jgi:hypothetical protein
VKAVAARLGIDASFDRVVVETPRTPGACTHSAARRSGERPRSRSVGAGSRGLRFGLTALGLHAVPPEEMIDVRCEKWSKVVRPSWYVPRGLDETPSRASAEVRDLRRAGAARVRVSAGLGGGRTKFLLTLEIREPERSLATRRFSVPPPGSSSPAEGRADRDLRGGSAVAPVGDGSHVCP